MFTLSLGAGRARPAVARHLTHTGRYYVYGRGSPLATFLHLIHAKEPDAMLGLPLDHVGVAVASIEEAAPRFERLTGSVRSAIESVQGQHVRVAFVGAMELIEPTDPETAVGRFIQKRGGGLHHVAYRTQDLAGELLRARDAGFELIDAVPRPGARGHLVAFLHPRSTGGVLVELVEHSR